MADGHWSSTYRRPPPRELLSEFVRVRPRADVPCERRFHNESYVWEALIRERGEPFMSHGAFTTREAAIRWAEEMRTAMESESWMEPLPPVPLP
jgi:hypothetical protein